MPRLPKGPPSLNAPPKSPHPCKFGGEVEEESLHAFNSFVRAMALLRFRVGVQHKYVWKVPKIGGGDFCGFL